MTRALAAIDVKDFTRHEADLFEIEHSIDHVGYFRIEIPNHVHLYKQLKATR